MLECDVHTPETGPAQSLAQGRRAVARKPLVRFGETGTCSICGGPYDRFGHNPEPLKPFKARVCTDCNDLIIVPARYAVAMAAAEAARKAATA
jgi:hypothetical protein